MLSLHVHTTAHHPQAIKYLNVILNTPPHRPSQELGMSTLSAYHQLTWRWHAPVPHYLTYQAALLHSLKWPQWGPLHPTSATQHSHWMGHLSGPACLMGHGVEENPLVEVSAWQCCLHTIACNMKYSVYTLYTVLNVKYVWYTTVPCEYYLTPWEYQK